MYSIYERIKDLCNGKGIKPAQMCKETGVSTSTITELKMGRQNSLSATTASKIANYFGVSVEYLLGQTEDIGAIVYGPEKTTYSGEEFDNLLRGLQSIRDTLREKEKAEIQEEDHSLNQDERYLLDAYRTMTDEQKTMMNIFIKGLKNAD